MSFCLFFTGFPYQIDGGDVPVIKILKTDSMSWSGLGLLQVFLHDNPGHGSHRPVPVIILHPDDYSLKAIAWFIHYFAFNLFIDFGIN
jgi:hypothetical protein